MASSSMMSVAPHPQTMNLFACASHYKTALYDLRVPARESTSAEAYSISTLRVLKSKRGHSQDLFGHQAARCSPSPPPARKKRARHISDYAIAAMQAERMLEDKEDSGWVANGTTILRQRLRHLRCLQMEDAKSEDLDAALMWVLLDDSKARWHRLFNQIVENHVSRCIQNGRESVFMDQSELSCARTNRGFRQKRPSPTTHAQHVTRHSTAARELLPVEALRTTDFTSVVEDREPELSQHRLNNPIQAGYNWGELFLQRRKSVGKYNPGVTTSAEVKLSTVDDWRKSQRNFSNVPDSGDVQALEEFRSSSRQAPRHALHSGHRFCVEGTGAAAGSHGKATSTDGNKQKTLDCTRRVRGGWPTSAANVETHVDNYPMANTFPSGEPQLRSGGEVTSRVRWGARRHAEIHPSQPSQPVFPVTSIESRLYRTATERRSKVPSLSCLLGADADGSSIGMPGCRGLWPRTIQRWWCKPESEPDRFSTSTPVTQIERVLFSWTGDLLLTIGRSTKNPLVYRTFDLTPSYELLAKGWCNLMTLKTGCWLGDDRHIAIGSENRNIYIWKLPRGMPQRISGPNGNIQTVKLLPVLVLQGHACIVNCCAASPPEWLSRSPPFLASSGIEKAVRLWQPQLLPCPEKSGSEGFISSEDEASNINASLREDDVLLDDFNLRAGVERHLQGNNDEPTSPSSSDSEETPPQHSQLLRWPEVLTASRQVELHRRRMGRVAEASPPTRVRVHLRLPEASPAEIVINQRTQTTSQPAFPPTTTENRSRAETAEMEIAARLFDQRQERLSPPEDEMNAEEAVPSSFIRYRVPK
eukprot:GHVT01068758.1.p1 GENE.GHVT01068758.1~~GHVT01068758.1.p1  ORF type:complete len:815 (+),score=35.65 GHVT01068758.1:6293-8737(+)